MAQEISHSLGGEKDDGLINPGADPEPLLQFSPVA
jgi:hypothetical protein